MFFVFLVLSSLFFASNFYASEDLWPEEKRVSAVEMLKAGLKKGKNSGIAQRADFAFNFPIKQIHAKGQGYLTIIEGTRDWLTVQSGSWIIKALKRRFDETGGALHLECSEKIDSSVPLHYVLTLSSASRKQLRRISTALPTTIKTPLKCASDLEISMQGGVEFSAQKQISVQGKLSIFSSGGDSFFKALFAQNFLLMQGGGKTVIEKGSVDEGTMMFWNSIAVRAADLKISRLSLVHGASGLLECSATKVSGAINGEGTFLNYAQCQPSRALRIRPPARYWQLEAVPARTKNRKKNSDGDNGHDDDEWEIT